MVITNPILQLKKVSISYTPGKNAVEEVSADIAEKKITAIMGPSGCGKSTLLRAINRMHELYPDIKTTGEILLNGKNILKTNPMEVRRMAGMVFQRPNPFPTMSNARRRANIPIADRCQRDGRPIDRIQKACEGIRLNLKQYQRRQKDIPNCQKPYREKVILFLMNHLHHQMKSLRIAQNL